MRLGLILTKIQQLQKEFGELLNSNDGGGYGQMGLRILDLIKIRKNQPVIIDLPTRQGNMWFGSSCFTIWLSDRWKRKWTKKHM
jgi:hypothetical protein